MKINASLSILINKEYTTIEVYDKDACITILKIALTPQQLSSALSRIMYTECDASIYGIEKIGKKMIHKQFTFEAPRRNMGSWDSEELKTLADNLLEKDGDGWVADSYFGSQTTFFEVDGKPWVRCTIRKWID